MESVGTAPFGRASSFAHLAHARAQLLHLVERSWTSCGFGRTLIVATDDALARSLRERGLRAESRPFADAASAAREAGAFDAVVVVDPPASFQPSELAIILSLARRWTLVSGMDTQEPSGGADVLAICATAGWSQSSFGPIAAEGTAIRDVLLFEPSGRATPRYVAEFVEWVTGFVRPNDHVVIAGDLPVAGIEHLWTHTEAARIGRHDAASTDAVIWLRQNTDDVPNRVQIDVIVLPDADTFVVGPWLARLIPGGRVLANSSGPLSLPDDLLIHESTTASAHGAGRRFVSFMRTPLGAERVPYVETVYPVTTTAARPAIVDFAASYENPWLVHALVIGRFRLRNDKALARLAFQVIETAPQASADAGGALCVLAYQALSGRVTFDKSLRRRLDAYLAIEPVNPHIWRWQVSLTFVAAKLDLVDGLFDRAEAGFGRCARMDFTTFAAHLGTKSTEAAFLAGWLAWQRKDVDAAATHWRAGLEAHAAIGRTPLDELLIDPHCPASFEAGDGLREVTIAADHALRCAHGLRAVRHARTRGAARPDMIDRSLLQTSRELEGFVARTNVVAADRLERLVAQDQAFAVLCRERDDAFAAAIDQRDRNLAGYALLSQSLTEQVSSLTSSLARETALTRFIGRASTLVRPALSECRRLVIFGTGRAGQFAAETLSRHHDVVAFVDNNPQRQGGRLFDCPVIAASELPRLEFDAVLVATMHAAEIAEQLHGLGIGETRVYFIQDAMNRLVVFGAGAAGQMVWEAMPRKDMILAFADNAVGKHGTDIHGLRIVAPAEIQRLDYRYVVVASLHRHAIERQLTDMGVPANRVIAIDPERPPMFVAAPPAAADLDAARAFHGSLEASDLERVRAFGQQAQSAALLDFEPVTLAVGAALAAGGCRVTAFGAPAFVDKCERTGLAATAAPFDAAEAAGYSVLVSGASGWPPALVGALERSQQLIAPRRADVPAHLDTPNLSFWYAPPRQWLASPLEI